MSSSEQQPLLPSSVSQERPEEAEGGLLSTCRVRVGEALESDTVHKLVITLVRLLPAVPLRVLSLTGRPHLP